YSDREFLLIFNVLLVGVLAIIFFSIIGSSLTGRTRGEMITLTILAILTVAVNAIALSAIVFRISEWGFTPNRTAVLGSNVLILIHLMRVIGQLYKVVVHRANVRTVGHIIAGYIPVYIAWALIVILIFPWLFGMK